MLTANSSSILSNRERYRDRDQDQGRDRDRGRDRGGFNKPIRGRRSYGGGGGYSSHTKRRESNLNQRDSASILFYGQPPLKELEDWKKKGLKFSGSARSSPPSNEEGGGGEDLGKEGGKQAAAVVSVPSVEEAYKVYREKYLK